MIIHKYTPNHQFMSPVRSYYLCDECLYDDSEKVAPPLTSEQRQIIEEEGEQAAAVILIIETGVDLMFRDCQSPQPIDNQPNEEVQEWVRRHTVSTINITPNPLNGYIPALPKKSVRSPDWTITQAALNLIDRVTARERVEELLNKQKPKPQVKLTKKAEQLIEKVANPAPEPVKQTVSLTDRIDQELKDLVQKAKDEWVLYRFGVKSDE